jgi:hypothetical protein
LFHLKKWNLCLPDDPNLVRVYIITKIGVFCQIADKHVENVEIVKIVETVKVVEIEKDYHESTKLPAAFAEVYPPMAAPKATRATASQGGQMTDGRGQQKLEKDQKQYLSPASLGPTESQRFKRREIRCQTTLRRALRFYSGP